MADQTSLTVASGEPIECSPGFSQGLMRTKVSTPFRAERIGLHQKSTSGQALVIIATSCLRQIALNQPGVRDCSGEALHQMRVGLRRLRAVLSIFKSVSQKGEFEVLKPELVWLTEQLAAAREYDVLCEASHKFEITTRSVLVGQVELTGELKRRQQDAFALASRAVASARFERLIFSSAVGLISRTGEKAKGNQPVRDLARRVLERRTRRVLQRLAGFARLGASERHALRIRVKKLRYGTEFFASLFPDANRKCKRFGRELEALQDTLGRLNDIAAHRQIARGIVEEGTVEGRSGRRIAAAMGALTGSEQAEQASLLAAVPKLRARLAKAPRYWR
jgi:CHAD domain-containing protein